MIFFIFCFGWFKFHYVQMELHYIHYNDFREIYMFKFHYVQMEHLQNYKYPFAQVKFKFHYVQMEQIALSNVLDNCLKFKFHYVQMEPFSFPCPPLQKCLNSTMFRWNEGDVDDEIVDVIMFKFHYVQMEPPLLTFQTSFNKA